MNNKPIIGLCLREACLELFWSNFNWTVYFFAGCISISFSVIACIQRQSCSGRFIFLHLSTLLRSDLPGSHVAKKLVLFWVRALQSFFLRFFLFMAYANLVTSPKRLETELPNITERHFCSLPVFCIEHSFVYFLLSDFFRYLFVLTYFDSSRRHTNATTHATGTQIVRAKMTSLDAIFCRGNKSSSCSLARFCRRKDRNSTDRASRSWKIWARLI